MTCTLCGEERPERDFTRNGTECRTCRHDGMMRCRRCTGWHPISEFVTRKGDDSPFCARCRYQYTRSQTAKRYGNRREPSPFRVKFLH